MSNNKLLQFIIALSQLESTHSSETEDEFDIFAKCIEVQLKKIPENKAMELMQKMQLMVSNARLLHSQETSPQQGLNNSSDNEFAATPEFEQEKSAQLEYPKLEFTVTPHFQRSLQQSPNDLAAVIEMDSQQSLPGPFKQEFAGPLEFEQEKLTQ